MDVMIVENSRLVRSSLRQALEAVPELRLVTEAEDAASALASLEKAPTDLILLDLSPFSGAEISLLGNIRAAGYGARILVLTDSPYPRFCQLCLAMGADAVFDKSLEFDKVVAQLRAWLPARPANEEQRLRTLEELKILDTPEEKVFDDLAALAAAIAGTPIGLVSLVDGDRQWFKAHYGLEIRESSRSSAFCSHAINGSDLFMVEDAKADPTFADNPLVRGEPHVEFYAGMPLVMPGGEALGTLCVIDRQPRTLTDLQKQALRVLARNVVAEFELRLRINVLEEEAGRRRSAEAAALQLATRDSLTGLPNRATLVDRLGQALRLAHRERGLAAVVFLDIDHFKWVNDTLGHPSGDKLLQTVGERLGSVLRDSDTVARLGGDEFAIVLPRCDGQASAQAIGDKVRAALAPPIDFGDHRIEPRCSIGIALYPEHGDREDVLMRHADLAMGAAKAAGGNGWQVYADDMGRQAQERLVMEADLRAALRNGELEPWYQPQVDFAGGTLMALETLLRWHHPRLGPVSPLRFIPLAEECGLIGEVGRFVLDRSLAQLVAWDKDGLRVPRVAVNVSALQLRPDFPLLVESLLKEYGLTAERLELEITESIFALDGPQLADVIQRLTALGVGFAVDDFGVGYSSLAQLKRFPVTTLKIDRAFTEELESSSQNRAIVQAITTLSRTLGMRTVAEGVEDAAQSAILRGLGCDDAQGYHHGRPMPAPVLAAWLAAQFQDREVRS